MATGTYNPGGGSMTINNVISLGYTCPSGTYPNGAISLSSDSGSYFYCSISGGAYTVTGYLCDSAGNNAYQVFTTTFNGVSTKTSMSGSVSNATGLSGKALYLKFVGEYVGYIQIRGSMTASITTYTPPTPPTPTPTTYTASTFSADNVEFGFSSKVTLSNAKISELKHTIVWTVGTQSHSTTTSVGATSASYTIPTSWMSQAPNSTSVNMTITVTTFHGSDQIGNAATKTYKATVPTTVVPSLSSVSAAIYNANANISNKYIQGVTGVTITFNGAAAGNGASLNASSYKLTCSKDETIIATTSANVFRVTTLSNSGSIKFTAKIKDSRGRTSEAKTVTISSQNYFAPVISSAIAFRSTSAGVEDEYGTYVTIRCNVNYKSFSGNTIDIDSVYYLSSQSASQGSVAKNNMTSGTQYTVGGGNIDPAKSYKVKFTATDTVGKTATATVDIGSILYSIHIKKGGKGVAFGKTSEYNNTVEVNPAWDLRCYGHSMNIIRVTTPSISSLPVTLSVPGMTSSHILINPFVAGARAAMAGNWTVSTANGSITIDGTVRRNQSGTFTLVFYVPTTLTATET